MQRRTFLKSGLAASASLALGVAPRLVRVELPWHLDAVADGVRFTPAALDGGDGLEDGFSFARESRAARVVANNPVRFSISPWDIPFCSR